MDFPGVVIENEKEKAELVKFGSSSEGVNVVLVASAAEAKSKSKNAVSSDGSLTNYFCDKGSITSQLSLGLAIKEQFKEEKGLPSWSRNVNGGAKRAAAEFIPRLDLSSVGFSCSDSINLLPNQSGFGSPIEAMGGFDHRTSSDDDRDSCSRFMTSFRPTASTIPGKQSGSQLIIFYGGMVNVYDDIPADKAQAIMLIASSGNYSSYPHTKVQNGYGSQITELNTSLPLTKCSEGSVIYQPTICKLRTDLPIARKHSLKRFLEKRKDRLTANTKSPYTTAGEDNAKPRQHPSSTSPLHSNYPP